VLAGKTPARQVPARRRQRSSLGGGVPAQQRVLRAQGRETVRRLLEAGLAEFGTRGLHAVSVDDVVGRAQTSHGTFYQYFSNKEDLFKALLRDVLHDMKIITDDFPVVTRNEGPGVAGPSRLRGRGPGRDQCAAGAGDRPVAG
jgi:AcrR family transcriptional regulator